MYGCNREQHACWHCRWAARKCSRIYDNGTTRIMSFVVNHLILHEKKKNTNTNIYLYPTVDEMLPMIPPWPPFSVLISSTAISVALIRPNCNYFFRNIENILLYSTYPYSWFRYTHHIDGKCPLEVVLIENASTVHQDVDVAELLEDGLERVFNLGAFGHIGLLVMDGGLWWCGLQLLEHFLRTVQITYGQMLRER